MRDWRKLQRHFGVWSCAGRGSIRPVENNFAFESLRCFKDARTTRLIGKLGELLVDNPQQRDCQIILPRLHSCLIWQTAVSVTSNGREVGEC